MAKPEQSLFELLFGDHLSEDARARLSRCARALVEAASNGLEQVEAVGLGEDVLCNQDRDQFLQDSEAEVGGLHSPGRLGHGGSP